MDEERSKTVRLTRSSSASCRLTGTGTGELILLHYTADDAEWEIAA